LKKLLLPEQTSNMSGSNMVVHPVLLAVRFPLRSFLAAFRFLTIIPLSWKSDEDVRFFQASLLWFPVIGLLIGLSTMFLVSIAAGFLPVSLTALFGMLLLGGVSGFLHLDGVADSGDGLLSSRPRERSLEIMRDSRTGAMGVLFLFFLLLAKYAALSSLSSTSLLTTLILMPVAGRTAILLTMVILPYARKEEGLGRLFYSKERYIIAMVALLFFVVCSWLLVSKLTLVFLSALLLGVGLFSVWCFNKLGGATGDTLGCVCELSELSLAIAAVLCQGVI
jgi:adenosylcobinamide-GDP ribazoletransferase